MPGNRWTDEEQAAYRSTLSLDRLRDEGWIVVSILYLCAASQCPPQWHWWWLPVGWAILGLALYLPGRRFLRALLPAHVLARLPEGRFDGAETAGALRSYRDLVRLWRDPPYQVPEIRFDFRPAPLSLRLALLAASLAVAVAGFALSLVLPRHGTPVLDALTISVTVVIPHHLFRRLRDRGYTSPAAGEVAAVVAVIVLAELSLLLLRWGGGVGVGTRRRYSSGIKKYTGRIGSRRRCTSGIRS